MRFSRIGLLIWSITRTLPDKGLLSGAIGASVPGVIEAGNEFSIVEGGAWSLCAWADGRQRDA